MYECKYDIEKRETNPRILKAANNKKIEMQKLKLKQFGSP